MRLTEYIHCNDTQIMNVYTYELAGMRKGNAFIRGTHAQCMSQEMQTLLILTNRPEVAVGAWHVRMLSSNFFPLVSATEKKKGS